VAERQTAEYRNAQPREVVSQQADDGYALAGLELRELTNCDAAGPRTLITSVR
ncbi:MAG: hypothetical protein QOH34_1852, partial [Mycobacterium sp.]|nr:hypothetical protein [Mycobacterium sp.]